MPTHRELPNQHAEQQAVQLTRGQRRMQVLDNLFSFRTLFACVLIAAIPAGLLGLLWHPLGFVFYPLFAVLWLGVGLSPGTVRKCPFCRKRVKGGATVCYRCGRRVA